MIESSPGFVQKPSIKWAPDYFFTQACSKDLILLYYTGINRVAKNILQEIVKGMFLNSSTHLEILSEMKAHAVNTYEAIQLQDLCRLAKAIEHTWNLNRKLNKATSTPEITFLLTKIKDYTLSCKLLGAGGGGYLMIFAKDAKAAGKIKELLHQHAPNPAARFVDWSLSRTGFQISKS